ncbi:unnamed protein product [Linum tenue]|uniref:Uncharacterized protein n=1 Tax=Linum tenue TaxID=586396 RepID=A0AAV0REV0_9ROSI|nr:unnamed protein product [Linum tenue]
MWEAFSGGAEAIGRVRDDGGGVSGGFRGEGDRRRGRERVGVRWVGAAAADSGPPVDRGDDVDDERFESGRGGGEGRGGLGEQGEVE